MENFDYRSILIDSGSIVHCSTVMIITEAGLELMMMVILIMIMMMMMIIGDDNDGGRPSSSYKEYEVNDWE